MPATIWFRRCWMTTFFRMRAFYPRLLAHPEAERMKNPQKER
jgi:hypothetical protein